MNLERGYARLLHFYPADYRRARGTELLDTLLASAADGRRRPPAREVAALILGGLRARAGHDRRRTAGQSWLAAFRVAAPMLLLYGTVGTASVLTRGIPYARPYTLIALVLGALAVVAALRSRYRAAAVAAAAAFAVALAATVVGPAQHLGGFWQFPFAVVLLVVLDRHRPQPVTGLLRWAPAVPVLIIGADEALAALLEDIAGILRFGVYVAVCLGGLLWLAVDERVGMAVGLLYAGTLLVHVSVIVVHAARGGVLASPAGLAVDLALAGAPPLLLLVAAGTMARRQAATL